MVKPTYKTEEKDFEEEVFDDDMISEKDLDDESADE